MELTKDVKRDLIKLLTMVGFSESHAHYVVWAASEDDNGKASEEWALRTLEKAIIRVCNSDTSKAV